MILKCIQANLHDLQKINLLMHRSKAYWGYDDAFMDKFMQLFQMTADYLEKNTVKLFCILDHDQEDLKAHGVNKFILWSDPGAETFYKKMGCIKIGVKKSPMMSDRYPVIFEYEI
jgi:hypothetical protein